MNRLLINMKNKVEILNGSIDMCYKLANDETIELNGMFPAKITRGENTKEDLYMRANNLMEERNNLLIRISRYES